LTSGSRGDVQPLIPLALRLQNKGHRVIFGASENFREWITSTGLTFQEFGTDVQAIAQEYAAVFNSKPLKMLKLTFSLLETELKRQYEQLLPLIEDTDIVIGASIQLAAEFVASAFNKPYYFITYAPAVLKSAEHPPFILPFYTGSKTINRLLWQIQDPLWNFTLLKPLNHYRQKLALKPLKNALDSIAQPSVKLIMAASPELATLPKDLKLKIRQTDHLFFFPEEELSADLESFLATDRPVIYLGFGSMTDHQPEKTTEKIIRAVKSTGIRLILSKGWAGLGHQELANHPEIKLIGGVDHHKLFPRLSGVIHHGGAGTTGTAARAGVPQLIVPHLMDQYYWGRQIQQLGLGPKPVRKNFFSEKNLINSLNELKNNKEYREQAKRVSEKILLKDGTAELCQIIETENL